MLPKSLENTIYCPCYGKRTHYRRGNIGGSKALSIGTIEDERAVEMELNGADCN